MCKQLLMHILEKIGYCSCFRWTTTSLHHQLNARNNNNNNNNNNIEDDEMEFKSCRSISLSVIIPPSSSFDGSTTNEESMLEVSIPKDVTGSKNEAQTFNYRELATATNNFRPESFIGEGGFGPVYRGKLETTGQVVAVKKLNQTGIQGDKEFLVEVLMLSLLRHPNLVNLIGYCAEGNQRLLVYEYMPLGSLADHLHDLRFDASPLDWDTRMKIAAGAAEGLDYLHNKAEPCVIFRDLKSDNILLDDGFRPRLSDFGLAKFGPEGDKSHVSTRVMGTQGYCAPEYAITGKLTKMSDIFSFGVVLLELITGQQAMDPTRGNGKHLLVDWAHSIIDSKNFLLLADPKLKGQFPEDVLSKAVEVASMCVRESPHSRPHVSEIVLAFKYLSSRHSNLNEVRNLDKVGDKIRKKPHEDDCVSDDADSTKRNKDLERKLAVADAKMWGETWREKRRTTETEFDSLAR